MRGKPFDEPTAKRLREARDLLSAEAEKSHHALYDRLREIVADAMPLDAFFVALFRDADHVLYAYQYDGAEYALPGIRPVNPEGPTGWVRAHNTSYAFRTDAGAILNRGIPWGDKERRSADALVVPMRRTHTGEVIGVVSAQTYTPDSYGDSELLAQLDDGHRPAAERVLSRSVSELVVERVAVVRQAVAQLAAELEREGHRLGTRARDLVRQCERLQIESAEIEFDGYRDAAARFGSLSPRERDVAELLAQSLRNDDIATRLHIGLPTVKTHVGNILRKYGAERRSTVAEEISAYLGYAGGRSYSG
ncbi:helix-turn-helix transcriptional regulator [Amycolatopsis rhabdoformis]|uniref:Helix-turn-helix transcriptional regulator n=1 Tax=Amycolatopsis rhabdoformis TaxID=1448059 RepID=A0ABZ1I3W2_9PSEU|nr:helix-turn-helix transcriptional regulator [Amycolatopsis rhabdoformis]WSE28253.1 helix-turn-helix transcriptional regulator [Amycolatopsis rhabdoformis]